MTTAAALWPRRALRITAWALALVLVAYALRRFGLDAFIQPWTRVGLPVLVLAGLTQTLSYLARAARLAQSEPEIGWRRLGVCLRLVLIHNAINLLVPMRGGELSFPWLMRRWFGVETLRAGALLLFLRLTDLQVLACGALIAMLGLGRPPGAEAWIAAVLALALLGPFALYRLALLARSRADGPAALRRLAAGVPEGRGAFVRALAWTWLAWTLKLLGLGMLFASMADAGTALGVVAAFGGDVSSVLPIHAPAGVGTYEAAAVAAVAPWTPVTPALLAAVVGMHAFVLGAALSLGGLAALAGGPRVTGGDRAAV